MSNKLIMVSALFVLFSTVASAGQVEIVMTEFTRKADTWHVGTTLRHDDTGWEHYADAWRVVDEQGNELGKRTLFHPHESEQPFTRYLSGVRIPSASTIVFVEAHDKVHGWSKQRVKVDLSKAKGDRYKVTH
jgi:hypothetical protein